MAIFGIRLGHQFFKQSVTTRRDLVVTNYIIIPTLKHFIATPNVVQWMFLNWFKKRRVLNRF